MKKTITTILAALICSGSPLMAETATEKKTEKILENEFQLGESRVAIIRDGYEKGLFDEFLMEMDADYAEANKENQLDGLIEMRKNGPLNVQNLETKASLLQDERNQALLNTISENDDSLFAQKVRSVVAGVSTDAQKKALSTLGSYSFMIPGTGANSDENALIELDLEYEYKLIHLSMDEGKDRLEKQFALRMEKMDKMKKAAQSFTDVSLKNAVGLAASNLDARLAQHWDEKDLNSLSQGKVKPANETEEKIASILSATQARFNDLMKDTL